MLPEDFVIGMLELAAFYATVLAAFAYGACFLFLLVTRQLGWAAALVGLVALAGLGAAWVALERTPLSQSLTQPVWFLIAWRTSLGVSACALLGFARSKVPLWARIGSGLSAACVISLLLLSFAHGDQTMT